jgi:dCMP deaminase
MKIAYQVSQRSTCSRMKTGALIIKDNRIISMGYNGVVPGAKHCCEYWNEIYEEKFKDKMSKKDFEEKIFAKEHHNWSIINEIHGEQNAILYACREGIATKNTDMYSLYSPCINCAKVIKTAGIRNVYYTEVYKRDQRGIDFLEDNGVNCIYLNISYNE